MLEFISLDKYTQKIQTELTKKSPYTWRHSERVAKYATLIAKEFLPEKELPLVETAGKMHDIGKVFISDSILNKNTSLTDEEYSSIKEHPKYSADYIQNMLSDSSLPEGHVQFILDSALYHHERYDGLGYPYGLSGTEIPLIGRIMSVADSFDAIHEKRPYNAPKSLEESLEEMQRCSGSQFDPVVTSVFIQLMKEEKSLPQLMEV